MKQDDVLKRFFNAESGKKWVYADDQCFLCLTELNEENETKEHVIPQWMLTRHDLWNASMTLLNGTVMRYRQLTIPSCNECNNEYLSRIEEPVARAFEAGYTSVDGLDRKILYMWLAKILYGLLVRERYAALSQRDRNGTRILSDEDLDRFAIHHLLMQAARGETVWHGDQNPWSIFVLKCQTSADVQLNFDYIDSFQVPCLAIRSGEVAVVAALQDWGYMQDEIEFDHMKAAKNLELHPLQFKELAIYFNLLSMAFFKERGMILTHGGSTTGVIPMPQSQGARQPNFKPNLILAAPTLARHFDVPIENVVDGQKVMTTLVGNDGEPHFMRWDGEKDYLSPTLRAVNVNGGQIDDSEPI